MKLSLKHFILAMATAAFAMPAMAQTSGDTETWKSIGTGQYRETSLHASWVFSSYPELDVEMEESEQTPGRYRLKNAYANYPDMFGGAYCLEGDHYIVVDASDPECVFIERSLTGYITGLVEDEKGNDVPAELVVYSQAGHMLDVQGKTKEEVKEKGVFGKLKNGCITFPNGTILGTQHGVGGYWENDDYKYWLYQVSNKNGNFRIKLPGAPVLDVTTDFLGIDDALTTLTYKVTLSADVQKAKCALVPEVAGNTEINSIISGATPSQEITASGNVEVPYTADGQFTFVVIPYYNDEPCDAVTLTIEFAYDQSEWRKTGTAMFNETLISDIEMLTPAGVGYPGVEYAVEIEENVERPGYIRMVNPYGDSYPYSNVNNYDNSQRWYLYIDATDPDHVYMEHSDEVGLNAGYGRIEIWSYYGRALGDETSPYYGWDMAKCEQSGFFGRYANNEITFPSSALCLRMPASAPGWYRCNTNGKFSLKFNEGQLNGGQSGVESVATDNSQAPAEYYRLDGTRVNADALTPGIYVVRRGDKASKEIIK